MTTKQRNKARAFTSINSFQCLGMRLGLLPFTILTATLLWVLSIPLYLSDDFFSFGPGPDGALLQGAKIPLRHKTLLKAQEPIYYRSVTTHNSLPE